MQPPRWFYLVLAACAVVLTLSTAGALVSLTYRLRYTTDPEHGALVDHWHRSYCLTGGCVSFDDTTGTDGAVAVPGAVPALRDTVGMQPQSQRPLGLDSMIQPRRER